MSAERWATRLGAPLIPGAVSADDFPEDGIVHSTVFGAGLRLPLGGGSSATAGLSGLLPGIFVEPYAARIDFDDELRLERQYLARARAGVDLNRNVGLRAYYWRGVDDEFSEWMDISGYGGEAQFLLNTGSGLSPFLVAGAGRIEFKDDYRDLDGAPRGRENHLILGGGAAFGLGDRVRVERGARNFLMTVGGELEDVTSPDDLVSNWQYSAGVSLAFGAREPVAGRRRNEPPTPSSHRHAGPSTYSWSTAEWLSSTKIRSWSGYPSPAEVATAEHGRVSGAIAPETRLRMWIRFSLPESSAILPVLSAGGVAEGPHMPTCRRLPSRGQ